MPVRLLDQNDGCADQCIARWGRNPFAKRDYGATWQVDSRQPLWPDRSGRSNLPLGALWSHSTLRTRWSWGALWSLRARGALRTDLLTLRGNRDDECGFGEQTTAVGVSQGEAGVRGVAVGSDAGSDLA